MRPDQKLAAIKWAPRQAELALNGRMRPLLIECRDRKTAAAATTRALWGGDQMAKKTYKLEVYLHELCFSLVALRLATAGLGVARVDRGRAAIQLS